MEAFRWYVAAALSGLEATAIYHLSRAGISAFSPTFLDKGGFPHRQVKLFPGYVFVELSAPDPRLLTEFRVAEAGVVRRTRGIHAMLPIHSLAPDPLPVGFVEDLRSRMASGDFDANAALSAVRRYGLGDVVPIESGPWAGFDGEMVKYRKGSLVLLLALLGAKRAVEIPCHQVAGGGPDNKNKRPTASLYGRNRRQRADARRVAA